MTVAAPNGTVVEHIRCRRRSTHTHTHTQIGIRPVLSCEQKLFCMTIFHQQQTDELTD